MTSTYVIINENLTNELNNTGGPKIIGHPPAFEFKIIFYFQNMMLLASCLHACVHIFMQYLHLSFIILSLTIQMINKAKTKKLPSQNYRTPLSFLNSIILSYASNNVTHLFFLCIYRGKHLVSFLLFHISLKNFFVWEIRSKHKMHMMRIKWIFF